MVIGSLSILFVCFVLLTGVDGYSLSKHNGKDKTETIIKKVFQLTEFTLKIPISMDNGQ